MASYMQDAVQKVQEPCSSRLKQMVRRHVEQQNREPISMPAMKETYLPGTAAMGTHDENQQAMWKTRAMNEKLEIVLHKQQEDIVPERKRAASSTTKTKWNGEEKTTL